MHKKYILVAIRSALIVGLFLWAYGFILTDKYAGTLPHFEDIAERRVYPLNVHGTFVFQTKEERDRLRFIDITGISSIFLGLCAAGWFTYKK
jgi:hypothetical protein